MGAFQKDYRRVFARLGFPLKTNDGVPAEQIAKREQHLGVKLPVALRDYYLVAGKHRRLNQIYERLYATREWDSESGKLVFMEENQTVVVWAVAVAEKASTDAPVFQSPLVDGEIGKWYLEQTSCAIFLKVMLHWQAAYGGGMRFTASAPAPKNLQKQLARGWEFAGEVNKMLAYSRQDQAICVLPWREFFERKKILRVFAGAHSKAGLETIARDIGLEWEK